MAKVRVGPLTVSLDGTGGRPRVQTRCPPVPVHALRSGAAVLAAISLVRCDGSEPRSGGPDGGAVAERPASASATAPYSVRIGESDSLTIRPLAPGVWLHTTWIDLQPGVIFPSNGLLVDSGGELWLVNTAWGVEHTEALLAWVDETLGRALAGVVVTHFHDDSLAGTPVLRARGVPVWGHPLTVELAASTNAPPPQSLEPLPAGGATTIGGLEIFYPGPAHTRDNVVVWVPESSMLFGGCAVRPAGGSSLGNVADADVSAWPGSMRRVLERYGSAETVVPSHGEPGGVELLAHTIRLAERGL